MHLVELLPREHIVAPLQASSLRAALSELVACLHSQGAIHDVATVELGLNGPRARDIVAAGPDVVLPHYRTSAVDTLRVALGIAPAGLDAGEHGLEIRPRIVALILAPKEAATLYLQTVSALARLFRDPDVVERVAGAQSPAQVIEIAGIGDMRLQPRLMVRDIMAHTLTSVTPATSLRDAIDVMVRRRIHSLTVVGDKLEVLGIISESDLMRALMPKIPRAGQDTHAAAADTLLVRDVMTRSVLCVSEEMGVEEAANMMMNKNVEQFPVTSEGKLTGFLTRADIIRKLFGR